MTTLTIRRLCAETTDPELTRVQQLLRLIADRTLEERRATYETLSGEWCVRRLDLGLDLPPDEPDSTAAGRWAALIAGTIRDLVPDGSNVLHFRSRSQQLLDLVVGLAAGNLSRAWAWRQAGLLAATDPDPEEQPVPALLAAMRREPRLALPVLVGAIEQAGVRAVHALLGPIGWAAVADLVRPGWRAVLPRAAALNPVAERRAAAVLAGSVLARTVRSIEPVPNEESRSAWAVLVLAEVDPAADPKLLAWVRAGLEHPVAVPVRGEAQSLIPGRVHGLPGLVADLVDGPGERAGERVNGPRGLVPEPAVLPPGMAQQRIDGRRGLDSEGVDVPTPLVLERIDVPPALVPEPLEAPTSVAPGLVEAPAGARPPESEPGVPTMWAGLLFVLNAATAAGLPDAIDTDFRLASRPLRWVLYQLALRLVPVAAADPAALALAGLTPAMPAPAGPPAEPLEDQALDQHAAEWTAGVGEMLEQARHPEDDTPRPTLWSLARRPGWIVADPGWIEVQLPLDEIDLLVRRAGLDLDPGWLDWMGVVVVFRYV